MIFKILDDKEKEIYKSDIIEMLKESDADFVPPLSARRSTLDTSFSATATEDGILSYYENMNKQMILGAIENDRLIGFVSYRENFTNDSIGEDSFPNIYISTLVLCRSERGRGITRLMYDNLFSICYPDRTVLTRTWSTNIAHTRILTKFGFCELKRIKDDRGEGIDTVYYKKPRESLLTTV